MAFALTPQMRAAWADASQDSFPVHRGLWSCADTPLGELPKAGAGLHILCAACWEGAWLGGRALCRRWPDWLTRPGPIWAAALRCRCGAARFLITAKADPDAIGFGGPEEEPSMAFARRLATWLTDGPVTVHDIAPALAAMPTAEAMRAAGL